MSRGIHEAPSCSYSNQLKEYGKVTAVQAFERRQSHLRTRHDEGMLFEEPLIQHILVE